MTLKASMTIEQYNELSPEPLMAALRAELGCHEPLCVLAVTAAPGSVILTVVATDRASDSQVHAAATAMGSIDTPTLSAKLGISISQDAGALAARPGPHTSGAAHPQDTASTRFCGFENQKS